MVGAASARKEAGDTFLPPLTLHLSPVQRPADSGCACIFWGYNFMGSPCFSLLLSIQGPGVWSRSGPEFPWVQTVWQFAFKLHRLSNPVCVARVLPCRTSLLEGPWFMPVACELPVVAWGRLVLCWGICICRTCCARLITCYLVNVISFIVIIISFVTYFSECVMPKLSAGSC